MGAIAAKQDKRIKPRLKRISPRLIEAIRLIETGECKTVKAAAALVNFNYNYLSECLNKPEIREFIERQRAKNIQRAALRASYRIAELVDAQSEQVSLKASERILEQSGDLRPAQGTQVSVNVGVSAGLVLAPGYVYDLRESDEPVQNSGSDTIIEHNQ